MKGLLLKDCLLIKKQFWWFLFILIPALIIMPQIALFFMFLIPFVPSVTFESDTSSRWDKMVHMLPVTRKKFVISKYLLGLETITIFLIITALCQLIASTDILCSIFSFDDRLLKFTDFEGMFFLTVLIISIQFPLVFQFGSQKGSLISIGLIAFSMGVIVGLDNGGISFEINDFIENTIALAIPVVSVFLSMKIVDRKWKKWG